MSDITVGIKLKADGSGLVGELKTATGKVQQFDTALNSTSTSSKTGSKSIDKLNSSLDRTAVEARKATSEIARTDRATEGLKGQVAGLGALFLSGFAVRDLTRFADEATSVKNKIQDVTNSSDELARMQVTLLNTANDTRSGLSATTDLYATLNRNARTLVESDQALIDVTATITKSFALSGATAAEADGSIRQLSQGLAAGALRGDEFNSVAEGAPEIMRAIAKETGLTTGELREFAAEGKITAEIVVSALQNAADGIDARFDKMTATLEQNLTVAENNLISFVGAQNEALGVTNAFGGGIVTLSENLDLMTDVLLVGATLMAGKYLASIVAATAAKSALIRQALIATPAVTGLSAAMGRKAASATAASIATNALTISLRGLNVAMAFLGGPVGLAITAGLALYYFAGQGNSAKTATSALSGEIQELTNKFVQLNKAERAIALDKLAQKEIATRQKIIQLQRQLEDEEARQEKRNSEASPSTNQFSGISQAVSDNGEIAKITTEIKSAELALSDLATAKKELSETSLELDKDSQSIDKYKAANDERVTAAIASYENQTDAYSRELQLREAVLNGSLSKEEAAIYGSLWNRSAAQAEQTARLEQQINNFYDTEIERAQSNADQIVVLEQQKQDRLAEVKQLARENEQLLNQEHQLALDETNQTFWEKMQAHIASTTENFDAMWGNTFNNFAQGIGDATSEAILEQKSFGDAARSIARSAIKELISGLIQLGVKKLALAAIEKTIGVTGAAVSTATAISSGTAMAAAYAPAAAMASLASFGANSVPAMSGIGATVGLAEGLALAGIAHDGLPINRNEGTYLVRKDEMVLNPKQRENFEQVVENTSGSAGKSGNNYIFSPQISIDATNATPGMEEKIRQQVDAGLKEFDGELRRDFSNNGMRSQMLSGRAA